MTAFLHKSWCYLKQAIRNRLPIFSFNISLAELVRDGIPKIKAGSSAPRSCLCKNLAPQQSFSVRIFGSTIILFFWDTLYMNWEPKLSFFNLEDIALSGCWARTGVAKFVFAHGQCKEIYSIASSFILSFYVIVKNVCVAKKWSQMSGICFALRYSWAAYHSFRLHLSQTFTIQSQAQTHCVYRKE